MSTPIVAAYYFPHYHAAPRNEQQHGPGWTEWELVRQAQPRPPARAWKVAQAFQSHVPPSGIVLIQVRRWARGGAALSLQRTSEVPMKFLGVGEKPNALEVFAAPNAAIISCA